MPVRLDYYRENASAGLDLAQLEQAFQSGAKVFLFSNLNNPTGAVYSEAEIDAITRLADRHGVSIVADPLYSRMQYTGTSFSQISSRKPATTSSRSLPS